MVETYAYFVFECADFCRLWMRCMFNALFIPILVRKKVNEVHKRTCVYGLRHNPSVMLLMHMSQPL